MIAPIPWSRKTNSSLADRYLKTKGQKIGSRTCIRLPIIKLLRIDAQPRQHNRRIEQLLIFPLVRNSDCFIDAAVPAMCDLVVIVPVLDLRVIFRPVTAMHHMHPAKEHHPRHHDHHKTDNNNTSLIVHMIPFLNGPRGTVQLVHKGQHVGCGQS